MKVAVTGGNGKVGKAVVAELQRAGHEVISMDRTPHSLQDTKTLTVDIQHEGQVFDSLYDCDSVVHLAGYPRPGMVPDFLTFSENVKGTFNILNACSKIGIKNVVCASSMAAYGFRYAPIPLFPDYLPIDEKYKCEPVDPYGLSKLVGENIAESFSRLSKMKIISLRFPQVIDKYSILEERLNDPSLGVKSLWLYIDLRDIARAVRLGLEKNLKASHEVFLIAASDSVVKGDTTDIIKKFLPNTKVLRPEGLGNWSCLDISKAQKVLGFNPQYRWEDQAKL